MEQELQPVFELGVLTGPEIKMLLTKLVVFEVTVSLLEASKSAANFTHSFTAIDLANAITFEKSET